MSLITVLSLVGIATHLLLRFGLHTNVTVQHIPLWATLALGGIPLLYDLLKKLAQREFGSDLLAGISIVSAVLLGEYLAGAIVVLMLAGGEALESYAVGNATSVLRALAKRVPSAAHRRRDSQIINIALDEVAVGDTLAVFPHDICPVDGVVVEGHGMMDESFLTGEPFKITKAPGSTVISGAINGESALTITATKRAVDSRYAKIMEVMRESEQHRPRMRRLGDQLGALYTPLAVALAIIAWTVSGEATRFLAVLVIATPCPLLIAIPIGIIGSISLCARRAIIVKDPVTLEQIDRCRTAIFDKTGTLTYGQPKLTEEFVASEFSKRDVLQLAASVELYSKHPLARAILAAASEQKLQLQEASRISEPPGQGLSAIVAGREVQITSRQEFLKQNKAAASQLPSVGNGLECIVLIDGRYVATYRFRDAPRAEGLSFIKHLGPRHHFQRVMIVSGDRESEVRYLAQELGIGEIHAQKTPEEKVEIVRAENTNGKTLYVGDGINDAPAMMAATVGIAIGQNSDVTAEAAGIVVLESSLKKVDEFMHISRRMRAIVLQSALGGMTLSAVGMLVAASGHLSPVAGALTQEVIDVLAVLNALRAAFLPRVISDL
ncbi:MAG TPA: heavy metal translocating P-type ATPase [Chthoniobacterales bacterium]|jgi:heavy metal translocating P-type ATPase|nr:heavy metal translocating P-type ATPase [Chthoniobacterales bacterium]